MRDITERIDAMCEEMHGHTHWACMDTMSDQEKVGLDQVADIVNIDGQQVAFYYDEDDEDINERTYLVLHLDPDTGEVEGTAQWTVAEILREINRDRGIDWTDYDESDWQEGWVEFVEGKPCYGGGYHAIPELWKSVCVAETPGLIRKQRRKSRIRQALKEASISIACALEDNMENLQMSDLEHIQDKITELENLIDPAPFTNGQRQGVTHD